MTRDSTGDDWYEMTRRCTLRLARIRSVSPSAGEDDAARETLRLLHEGGLAEAYTDSGLDPLPGDPYGRHNAYAFLRGRSRRTIVLLGHVDTVDTADYGELEPWALDPEALAERLDTLARSSRDRDLADDLARYPGDWMFGRGVADMKSGVAATIAVMRRLAQLEPEDRPLSVVLLATPDEEHESAGVLQAVRFLDRLRTRHDLDYAGAINTDYSTAHYAGDPHRYIYTGTVGKLLPSLYVVGRPAHAGAPFDGVDANLLLAELVRDLSMNPALCDVVGDYVTPPAVTLRAADLKEHYDTQLAFDAYAYLNVLTLATSPADLLARLRALAEAALGRALGRVDAAERRWPGASPEVRERQGALRSGTALTYADLYAEAAERLGRERVGAALAEEWERLPVGGDRRARCLRLVRRLWALSGKAGPAVVLYYSPPYYPHVAPFPCPLHEAAAAVAAAHPELKLRLHDYFPLLSDLSYLRHDPGVDLTALRDNMPVWQAPDAPARPGAYSLPLDAMAKLNLPFINLGPYGRGVHQRGERVLMSYAFGTLPALIYETIERLAEMGA